MGYIRVDNSLAEQGVAVDILNDASLFVKIRASRSKVVEQERQKQQAPYRNIIMSGRPLPAGISRLLGQKITANAVVVGLAGTLPDDTQIGRVENGKPVEFGKLEPDAMIALFEAFPDFEEDVSGASQVNATFEAVKVETAPGEPEAPTLGEAVGAAAGN